MEEVLFELFKGQEENHGEFIFAQEQDSVKVTGKGVTKREAPTLAHWQDHVAGKNGLGIIPIRSDSTCYWGVIDIDQYDLDLPTLATRIHKLKLPMVPFRSKSGGCHLAVFFKEPVDAKVLQEKLGKIAASLGYGGCEIFPKQTQILVDRGDTGNWLNMPYYNGDMGMRYALDENGNAILLEDFVKFALDLRITVKQLKAIKIDIDTNKLPDGPPCLQALVQQGFPKGTRNNGLFAMGVFARKFDPDGWETLVEAYNRDYMDPPLDNKEVDVIKKQLNKKDYNYMCSDMPLKSFCDANTCRTRRFGIGGSAIPSMTGLRKIPTDDPIWFLEINGQTVELDTDSLMRQQRFQEKCITHLNLFPPKVADRVWQTQIQTLLDSCEILETPENINTSDQFIELFDQFIRDSRLRTQTMEEVLIGRVWVSDRPTNRDDGSPINVYFQVSDLEKYLAGHEFKKYNRTKIYAAIKEHYPGWGKAGFKIRGVFRNMWYVPDPLEEDLTVEPPYMGESNVL